MPPDPAASSAPLASSSYWDLMPGQVLARAELHARWGGQRQSGIVTPRAIPDILIFTDPVKAARYGYDQYEGLRADGVYCHTGEGQAGDQQFVRGNLALRDSSPNERPVRLFVTRGTQATYVGRFATGVPTYRLERIRDVAGTERQGIVFNLVPVDALVSLLPRYGRESPVQSELFAWTPPESDDAVTASVRLTAPTLRAVSTVERELQLRFAAWLEREGTPARGLKLPVDSATLEPDFYVPARGWIVEATASSARSYVHRAIGQVLDYVHAAGMHGISAAPVLLLPGEPAADLRRVLARAGIRLVLPTADGFAVAGRAQ